MGHHDYDEYREALKRYTDANRIAWNEVTPIHRESQAEELAEGFQSGNFSTLDEIADYYLEKAEIEGKAVVQLSCNNGREVLSMLNMGASKGVGFDISDSAIEWANELKAISGLNAEFHRMDVFDIPEDFNEQFDIAYISVGALAWIPDLGEYFRIAHRLLKPGGLIIIYETHPFTYCFAAEGEEDYNKAHPLEIKYPYYRQEPIIGKDGLDYYANTSYKPHPNYEFSYTITDVLNNSIAADFFLLEFTEFGHDISNCFEHLETMDKIPLSFVMVAKKGE